MKSKKEKTPVLIITPETGPLNGEMGPFARFVSGKSGGLGQVISALCEGLTGRGIDCHLATLNLGRRFQNESSLSEKQWREILHSVDPERIHLAHSSVFEDLTSAYAGNPTLNAAEFQRDLVNHIIMNVRSKYAGRIVLHTHDWMAGGIVSAAAKSWGCPILHTLHNVHNGQIPLEMFRGVNTRRISNYLYFSNEHGRRTIDCQATAVKNASMVTFVGHQFLREIMANQFHDLPLFTPVLRREILEKYQHGAVKVIDNAPSPALFPEHCEHLVRNYGPEDDILAAKRENRVEFQRRTGLLVNPDAILLYWPSRLDQTQKGIHLLEDIAHRFVIEHGDVQIAIVGDGQGTNKIHEEYCGRIAWSSGGKIAYHHFTEPLSMLGFAAASDVFGASLYEPCGQIDQLGNLYGATATNRDTGGYHDKIQELTLSIVGTGSDSGNGFLFRDYDSGGLWYGLHRTVEFHRRPPDVRDPQLRRIMRETRQKYSLDHMVGEYVAAYEKLNGGVPLS